jgi:hypothetical protein
VVREAAGGVEATAEAVKEEVRVEEVMAAAKVAAARAAEVAADTETWDTRRICTGWPATRSWPVTH